MNPYSHMSGYHADTLNLSQGHQGCPQGQGCLAISLICMSHLYNTCLSNSALQLTSDHEPVCFRCILFGINSHITNSHPCMFFNRVTAHIEGIVKQLVEYVLWLRKGKLCSLIQYLVLCGLVLGFFSCIVTDWPPCFMR